MVDESGNARIMDFGLATIAPNPHSLMSSLDDGYTARWSAPEILKSEPTSRESDIFSFGMVIIEVGGVQLIPCRPPYPSMKVFTGKAPFFGNPNPAVVVSIICGRRPERPSHATFTDCLWELTQKCLEQVPSDRPNVEQALETLRKLSVLLLIRMDCVSLTDLY